MAWERDLSLAPEVEDWHKWNTQIHKGVLNVALIEASYKVHARGYLVPEPLSKMYPGHFGFLLQGFWSDRLAAAYQKNGKVGERMGKGKGNGNKRHE